MAKQIALQDSGFLVYDSAFFGMEEADHFFSVLRTDVAWQQEFTRGRPFPRMTAWYADDGLTYSYSGVTHQALPWSAELLQIKHRVEDRAQADFNSLLLNLYRHGKDSMGMHADDERELGTNPVIASVSFGAVRTFVLRHRKSRQKLSYELAHGSLLIMGGTCQHHWLHGIPKTVKPVGQRINLTFRKILPTTH